MNPIVQPDLSAVTKWEEYQETTSSGYEDTALLYEEAVNFLTYYEWCVRIRQSYVGLLFPSIVGVFLFHIEPNREDVDEWIWVIVGDLPPAYLTCEQCPNAAAALDGYIGAMEEWVEAAERGNSVADLIPVNVPANAENARALKSRLTFLDERILSKFEPDLLGFSPK